MEQLIEKAAVLIEALPYIQEFRNSVVVVKFGGSAMEDVACTRGVIRDIVFMECAGMKPVIDSVFPLAEFEQGLARIEGRKVFGKVIVTL